MATTETAAKKDVQKLQRAIIDGLEDVKAQNIAVFNTEHLSPLFERVIVASGTSNRQTKALAASVRDAVRDAGFGKPRIEGEENGEWIIVDCGAAVAHIMQPTIREYYRLEEIWGDTPVRLTRGADKPAHTTKVAKATKASKDKAESAEGKKPAAKKVAAKKTAVKAEADKPARKTAVKATAKTATKSADKPVAKTAKSAAAKPALKAPAKKAPAKKPALKAPAKKTVSRKKPSA